MMHSKEYKIVDGIDEKEEILIMRCLHSQRETLYDIFFIRSAVTSCGKSDIGGIGNS